MKYKQKVSILAALVAVLTLVYALSFVFDPGRSRSAAFAWLDASLLNLADRIEITGNGFNGGASGNDGGAGSGSPGPITLIRKNNVWVFSAGADEYPVKQTRVEDLLTALTKKEAYTLRAVSPEAGEKMGFSGGNASRILVRGGAGMPLLDLLVGGVDALGRDVYLKRADKNEIFSGADRLTFYTENLPNFWYDLRLFPEGIAVSSVQQAELTLPPVSNENGLDPDQTNLAGNGLAASESYILRRGGGGWVFLGRNGAVDPNAVQDSTRVESWLRSVLEAEGEDFAGSAPLPPALSAAEAGMAGGRIILRLGDGSTRTIQTGDEHQRRVASVSGSRLSMVLTEWTLNRLFRESSYFLKTE